MSVHSKCQIWLLLSTPFCSMFAFFLSFSPLFKVQFCITFIKCSLHMYYLDYSIVTFCIIHFLITVISATLKWMYYDWLIWLIDYIIEQWTDSLLYVLIYVFFILYKILFLYWISSPTLYLTGLLYMTWLLKPLDPFGIYKIIKKVHRFTITYRVYRR